MSTKRKQYSAQFKLTVALEAVKESRTRSEIAAHYEVHPMQVSKWKAQLLTNGSQLFERQSKDKQKKAQADQEAQLYEQIGRLKVEVEWLKKKSTLIGR